MMENLILDEQIKVRVDGGYLVASPSGDPDYPGIWIEFIKDDNLKKNGSEDIVTNKQVLVEQPKYAGYKTGEIRVLIWEDEKDCDFTKEIKLTND